MIKIEIDRWREREREREREIEGGVKLRYIWALLSINMAY